MHLDRRLVALRMVAILGLAASATLTSDALHPDEHGFCPLEAACAAARSSALGQILGVPTSSIGLMAFGALLVMTLLPWKPTRSTLKPAGLLAALSGVGLVGYQAIALHGFCPLCLVADSSGIVAGIVVLGWDPPPMRRGGKKRKSGEHLSVPLRWVLIGALAVAAPLLWPRGEKRPSWVPLPEMAEFDAPPASAPTVGDPLSGSAPNAGPRVAAEHVPSLSDEFVVPRPRAQPLAERPTVAEATPPPAPPVERAAPAPPPIVADVRPPAPPPAPPPPPAPKREIPMVEYLNAFCMHCRATHARLERILPTYPVAVREQRIYVWPSGDAPLWAKACVCARTQGKEEALFGELLRLDEDGPGEVWDAARRAGCDVDALREAVARGEASERLSRYQQRMRASRIEGLPTIDVGRRRLQGEQSEDELRAALDAAAADLR